MIKIALTATYGAIYFCLYFKNKKSKLHRKSL